MTSHRLVLALIVVGVVVATPFSFAQTTEKPAQAADEAVRKFGPYEALTFDKTMLADVKVDASGNIFLMLQPDKTGAQITMKISMEKGSAYRKWSTSDEIWHAQQNAPGGRTAGAWSDRIQTSANYIEYWAEGRRFLWLKKLMP